MPDFAVKAIFGAMDKFSTVLGHMGVNMGKFGERAHGAFALAEKGASIFKSVLGANLLTGAIQRVGHEIAQLPKVLEDFAERGEQIGRVSSIIGTTADNWQRLAYAAKLTDTPVESLQGAMQKLNRNMADLTVGKGTLMDLMKYGPRGLATSIRGTHDTTEALMLLSDAMVKTRDPQVRARMAVAAFGKAGQEMIPFLLRGREGIHELMKEASLYGSVLDDKTIAASEKMAESMKRFKGMVGSVRDQVLSFVVKAMQPYLEKAMVWLAANKEIIATKIDGFIKGAAEAFRQMAPILGMIIKGAGWLIKNWPLLAYVYLAWQVAALALDAALDANPIGLITIGIEAMILAVITVIHYWKEITGTLQSAWNWFNRLLGNPWIKIGLSIIAEPLLVIAAVIQTIVDLIQGKGISAFKNLIKAAGPLGLFADMLGFGKSGANAGNIAGGEAPNKGQSAMQFINQVNVDNSKAPGVTSAVRTSQPAAGNGGMQYAMGAG
jgi:phage-related protein